MATDNPLEPGQWHEIPPLKPGDRAVLDAEGRLRVEGDTTPGVCQICKAPNPGHHSWCDAAPRPALPPGPWRIEPIPRRKDLRVVAPNGSLLAEVTGPDKAAVAALLVRAREVEDAAVGYMVAEAALQSVKRGDVRLAELQARDVALERLRAALGGGG